MPPILDVACTAVWIFVGRCTSALGEGARPYNTCIVKVKVSLLLYNFIDKGNAELLSSLLSLLVALSTPTSFSRYNTPRNYRFFLDHARFLWGRGGWGGGALHDTRPRNKGAVGRVRESQGRVAVCL